MKKSELKWKIQCLEMENNDLMEDKSRLQETINRLNKTIHEIISEISANKYTSKIKKCLYCNNYERSLCNVGQGQCVKLRATGVSEKEYYKKDTDVCCLWKKSIRDIR